MKSPVSLFCSCLLKDFVYSMPNTGSLDACVWTQNLCSDRLIYTELGNNYFASHTSRTHVQFRKSSKTQCRSPCFYTWLLDSRILLTHSTHDIFLLLLTVGSVRQQLGWYDEAAAANGVQSIWWSLHAKPAGQSDPEFCATRTVVHIQLHHESRRVPWASVTTFKHPKRWETAGWACR